MKNWITSVVAIFGVFVVCATFFASTGSQADHVKANTTRSMGNSSCVSELKTTSAKHEVKINGLEQRANRLEKNLTDALNRLSKRIDDALARRK